ncbi:MAG: D-alanyl-D-alanine carboxypeptidase [Bacilli bacterium]|nr:D-alanyl-D-alanine carboxypeptidase [Bacilli bacterium]
MKKFVVIILCFLFFSLNVSAISKGNILIEYNTGEVLMDNNSFLHTPPASMTKMMTLLIAMEKIDSGKIKLSDVVTVSENAANMGGSQVYLQAGDEITLDNLIKSICIASANDSAVALAEYIAGTEEKFVKMMNEKVKELGLSNSNFENVHGLDSENHYSCPYDMAMIAKELLKHEKILEYSSIYEEYLKKPDGSSVWMVNTNKLIRYYKGLDGLKTGFTNTAGYCLTATAKRNDMRLISVVMGSETSEERSKETIELLDYGFNNYKLKTIFDSNTKIGSIKVKNGKKDYVDLKLVNDVVDLTTLDSEAKYDHKLKIKDVEAPINVGDIVGKLELYKDGKKIKSYDITVKESIKKANLWDLYKKNFKYLVSGNI